jgi:hypothetical protein
MGTLSITRKVRGRTGRTQKNRQSRRNIPKKLKKTPRNRSRRKMQGGKKDVIIITAFGSALNKVNHNRYSKNLSESDHERLKGINNSDFRYTDIVTKFQKINTDDNTGFIDTMSSNFKSVDELLERGKQGLNDVKIPLPLFREVIEIQDNKS